MVFDYKFKIIPYTAIMALYYKGTGHYSIPVSRYVDTLNHGRVSPYQ